MHIETIEYVDYNNTPRVERAYFNLDEIEAIRFEVSYPEGVEARVKEIAANDDRKGLVELLERLILMSYGIKSEDGRVHLKTDDIYNDFRSSAAYNQLFINLMGNSGQNAVDFFNSVVMSAANRVAANKQVDD